MKLRVLEQAEAEVESACQYLNRAAPDQTKRFLDDLESALAEIQMNPVRFPLLETLDADHPYRRVQLRTFRYLVIYEVTVTEILIIAVAHASRASDYWIGRVS